LIITGKIGWTIWNDRFRKENESLRKIVAHIDETVYEKFRTHKLVPRRQKPSVDDT